MTRIMDHMMDHHHHHHHHHYHHSCSVGLTVDTDDDEMQEGVNSDAGFQSDPSSDGDNVSSEGDDF
jgi:hypothetical protein